MISLDVDNRSCCGLSDVCECWQVWSCTNIMCRAACITSVLHECFLECYNLSVEICSCLTLWIVGHDCLYQAGLLTICYAVVWQEQSSWTLCILVLLLIWVLQIVIACAASGCTTWLSIGPFSKIRLMLVRWLLPSLLNGCHVCFPWNFLKVNLSDHHIWRIKH